MRLMNIEHGIKSNQILRQNDRLVVHICAGINLPMSLYWCYYLYGDSIE